MRYDRLAIRRRRFQTLTALAAVLLTGAPLRADDAEKDSKENPKEVEFQPTEVGVRFTPAIAEAMSDQFLRRMRERYELDDDQVGKIRPVMIRQFFNLANKNAKSGRDFIEYMIAASIQNEGRFSVEDGAEFARKMKPLFPALKEFFAESSAEISGHMTVGQRLKFTGDVAGVTARLVMMESRMKRWEKGEMKPGANPFFDRPVDDPERATSEPSTDDPDEPPDHRRARQRVERTIESEIEVDAGWQDYVSHAIEYYNLDEAQQESARAILKECNERLGKVKTPELRAAMIENRIARQLTWQTKSEFSRGPWMHKLETEYEQMRKPLNELSMELKRRLETLPNSEQRARAEATARRALEEKGVGKSPV